MKTIATSGHASASHAFTQLSLAPYTSHERWWSHVAQSVAAWLDEAGINPIEALWVVPHASHVRLARGAWPEQRLWMPRIESWGALTARVAASAVKVQGVVTFRVADDRLVADQMLRTSDWAQKLARQNRPAYEAILTRLVSLAQDIAEHWLNQSTAARSVWLTQAREVLSAGNDGVADMESLLANVALEWAVMDERSLPDLASNLGEKAWILMPHSPDGGVPEVWRRWADSILEQPGTRVLLLLSPPKQLATGMLPQLEICDSFEEEANLAVARVAYEVNKLRARGSKAAVALIAQDRILVRRTHALLNEAGFSVLDESGWKLSTSRAASVVMGLLRLADSRATADEMIDFLKGRVGWMAADHQTHASGLADEVESAMRKCQWTLARLPEGSGQVRARMFDVLSEAAWQLWSQTLASAGRLRWTGEVAHAEACSRLAKELETLGVWAGLLEDPAGKSLIELLGLAVQAHSTGQVDAAGGQVSHHGFISWVDAVLEDGRFHPKSSAEAPDVIVTSLNQAMWRSFPAWVFPGMDAIHLSAQPSPPQLLSLLQAETLGLLDCQRYAAQQRAFLCSVFSEVNVHPMARRQDGGAPVDISPLWQELALQFGGLGNGSESVGIAVEHVEIAPTESPRPDLSGFQSLLPNEVSASSYESLRQCPYLFYGRSVLRLQEMDELEDELEGRDIGTWLHDTLHDFHERLAKSETGPLGIDREEAQRWLLECAVSAAARLGITGPELLPHMLWFEQFREEYWSWLSSHQDEGYAYLDGEVALVVQPDALIPADLHLKGRIDRVDVRRGPVGRQSTLVVDYKTGSTQALLERLKRPGEDTQLAMYAAIMSEHRPDHELEAAYLALQAKPLKLMRLSDSKLAAESLVRGVAHDWSAMRQGMPLLALGEGAVCDYCEMRRLCRRDHWSEE